MSSSLVGISHHRTPIELREQVALSSGQAATLSRELAEGGEAVCLSTCNRTELYVVGTDAECASRSPRSPTRPHAHAYRLADEAAALHLFRVAAGLDSLVPGEGESSARCAAPTRRDRRGRCSIASPAALHAGKKVRAQTAIAREPRVRLGGRGRARAAGVRRPRRAPDPRRRRRQGQRAGGPESHRAGRVDRVRRQPNRSTTAPSWQDESARRPLPLERIGEELVRADVVVSSTSAAGFVISAADVAGALHARKGRPLLLIDLAVPRDLEPAIHELDDCYLYDIDDLESVVAETMSARRGEAERAEAIVLAEAEDFRAWQASLDVVPAIASLRARVEEIRTRELAKARTRLSASELEAVDSITSQILNKLLHLPTVRMKEAAAASDGLVYADAVRHLFGLGEEPECPATRSLTGRPLPSRRRRRSSGSARARRCAAGCRSPDGIAVLVRVGSRGSRLALTQAELAAERLRGPGVEIALVPITTVGDRIAPSPSASLARRGVFVKELEEALLGGRIDVAVHSAKDMTSSDTAGLAVGAYLPREDPRDALCGADALWPGMRVGTASVRRRALLLALEPTLSVEPLRGNIDTRLRKRGERGLDAIVLAACGLDRLGLGHEIGLRFEPEELLPEAAQGALALQVRAGRRPSSRARMIRRLAAASSRSAAASPRSAAAASLPSRRSTTARC